MSQDEPIFTPEDFLQYEARRRGVEKDYFRAPSRLILLYNRRLFDYGCRVLNGRAVDWLYGESRPLCVGSTNGREIGVFRAWVGAPAAAAMLEELIACGAENVFEVGVAGGLQPSLELGNIVVVTEAVRDEGTSRHYFEAEVRLRSSPELTNLLIRRLNLKGIKHEAGPVWTTDGVYRETEKKLERFRGQGVVAVNMETSALFAVAKYRNIQIASAQAISDILSPEGWKPAFGHEKVSSSLRTLLSAVVESLAEL